MKSKKVGKVKEVVVEAPPVVEAPEPSVEPAPPPPPIEPQAPARDEYMALCVKFADNTLTEVERERMRQIGFALRREATRMRPQ